MSLTVIGDHEDRTIQQLERCVRAEEGAAGVLCADGHVGYSQPVGGAVAYRNHISVSGVGYDIGCGNKAVRTDLRHEEIATDLPRIMDTIVDRISFGVHFGSRGFGHKTATTYLTLAGTPSGGMDAPPTLLPAESELGREYIE